MAYWTTIVAALALAALATDALAQSRTFYDASGHSIGRSFTDGQGTTTVYDAAGRVTGRTSTDSGGTTTVYDSGGRVIGHEVTTGKTKTIYDPDGRTLGRFKRNR